MNEYRVCWKHEGQPKKPVERKVPAQLPTCARCGAPILGYDYRFRGVGIGDQPSGDDLVYEHFPECP